MVQQFVERSLICGAGCAVEMKFLRGRPAALTIEQQYAAHGRQYGVQTALCRHDIDLIIAQRMNRGHGGSGLAPASPGVALQMVACVGELRAFDRQAAAELGGFEVRRQLA